jgi:dTMP kinase
VHPEWVRSLYGFAAKPNIGLYFKVPIDVSLKRILNGRVELKFHEAGMDLGLSDDPKESFRLFQSHILEEYDKIAVEYGLTVIDATLPIQKQQRMIREIVRESLKDYSPAPFLRKKENVYVA